MRFRVAQAPARLPHVILQSGAQRFDDATGFDPLAGPLAEPPLPKSRDTYAAIWPDSLGRPRASADYGTNGGIVLIRPSVAPERSDTVLVTTNRYKDSGDANATIDPMGIETRWENDQAGRRIRLEEGRLPSLPGNVVQAAGLHSTPCNPAGCTTPRITEFDWHPSGQLAKLTLVNAETGDQITRWLFGTTLDVSAIASNNLLRAKIYPESDDRPAPAAAGSDGVYSRLEFQYNRQGQQTEFKDADGTVHEYAYDPFGRLTEDRVPTLGAGLDDSVLRIGRSYDIRGFMQKVTSYSAISGGTVRNEVELGYDNFGQLKSDKQEHGGAVTGTTPSVFYNHASTAGYQVAANGAATLNQHRVHNRGNRLTQIEGAPNPFTLDRVGRMRPLSPDATGNWNASLELTWDAWSRIKEVKQNGATLGAYSYDGLTRRITRAVGGVTMHTYYKRHLASARRTQEHRNHPRHQLPLGAHATATTSSAATAPSAARPSMRLAMS